MALISELKTLITADASNFNTTLQRASTSATTFASKLKTGLTLAGVGIGLAVTQLSKMAEHIENIGDNAAKLGITAKAFQQLSYAAKIGDTNIEAVSGAMDRLNSAVFNAARGSKELSAVFSRLGLDPNVLKSLSADQQYTTVVDAIRTQLSQNEQRDVARQLFGRSGTDQLNLIRSNIAESIKEYDKLGVAVSDTTIASAEDFKKLRIQFNAAFKGVGNSLVNELLPFANFVLKSLLPLLKKTGDYIHEWGRGISEGVKVAKQLYQNDENGVNRFLQGVNKATGGSLDAFSDQSRLSANAAKMTFSKQDFGLTGSSIAKAPTLLGSFIESIDFANKAVRQFGAGLTGVQDRIDKNRNDVVGSILDTAVDSARKPQLITEEFQKVANEIVQGAKDSDFYNRYGSANTRLGRLNEIVGDSRERFGSQFDLSAMTKAIEELYAYTNNRDRMAAPPVQVDLNIRVEPSPLLISKLPGGKEFNNAVQKTSQQQLDQAARSLGLRR